MFVCTCKYYIYLYIYIFINTFISINIYYIQTYLCRVYLLHLIGRILQKNLAVHTGSLYEIMKSNMANQECIQQYHAIPIGSMYIMYGIFTYIYHTNQLNVGKYIYHTWILWVQQYRFPTCSETITLGA